MCCLFSCITTERYIYSASPPNSPFFNEKGQSELAGYYSAIPKITDPTEVYSDGFDIHGAYAIGNHWALTAGFLNRQEEDLNIYNNEIPFDSSVIRYNRNLFSVGAGVFIPLNPAKTITLNMYGGVDIGKFSFNENGSANGIPGERFYNNNITKEFFQPSVNFMPNKYFHASVIFKNSYVHYRHINTNYTGDELAFYSLDTICGQAIHFSEPALDFQCGIPPIPWLKVDFIMSNASNPFPNTLLDVRDPNFSIGLSVDFSKIGKKNSE